MSESHVMVVDEELRDELDLVACPEEDDETVMAACEEIYQEDVKSANDLFAMGERLERSILCYNAATTYGLNPTAVAIGQATGLFDNTALETMGCESFEDASIESQLGVESLRSAVSDTASKFGRKLLEHAGNWAPRLVGTIDASANRISEAELVEMHVKYAKDAANKTGHVFSRTYAGALDMPPPSVGEKLAAKAARFGGAKTALMIAAAIGTVGGVIAIAARTMPGAKDMTKTAMSGWFEKIRGAVADIKWPFGKLSFQNKSGRFGIGKLFCNGKPARSLMQTAGAFVGKAAALTKASFEAIKAAVLAAVKVLKSAVMATGKALVATVRGYITFIAKPAEAGAAKAGDAVLHATGSRVAGATGFLLTHAMYMTGFVAVMAALAELIHYVVIQGMAYIKKIMGS